MYLTVKEASYIYKISPSAIYTLFKNDPTFPAMNVGLKKKIVIDENKLIQWIKTRNLEIDLIRLPSNRITFIRRRNEKFQGKH